MQNAKSLKETYICAYKLISLVLLLHTIPQTISLCLSKPLIICVSICLGIIVGDIHGLMARERNKWVTNESNICSRIPSILFIKITLILMKYYDDTCFSIYH